MLSAIIYVINSLVSLAIFSIALACPIWMPVLISFLKKKMIAPIEAKYDEKLEKLKGKIQKITAENIALLDTYGNTHGIAQAKRLAAIEEAWEAILSLRNVFQIGYLDYILTKEEFENIFSDSSNQKNSMLEILNSISSQKLSPMLEIEKIRPYLGENLWKLFFLYRQAVLRIASLYELGAKTRKLSHWTSDQPLKRAIEYCLSSDEVKYIYSKEIGALDALQRILEGRFLSDSRAIMSGKLFLSHALDDIKELDKIREINSTDRTGEKL